MASVRLLLDRHVINTSCDVLSALEQVETYLELIKCSEKHADMISLISALWEKSSFSPVKNMSTAIIT